MIRFQTLLVGILAVLVAGAPLGTASCLSGVTKRIPLGEPAPELNGENKSEISDAEIGDDFDALPVGLSPRCFRVAGSQCLSLGQTVAGAALFESADQCRAPPRFAPWSVSGTIHSPG
jgi:hypothetical protein